MYLWNNSEQIAIHGMCVINTITINKDLHKLYKWPLKKKLVSETSKYFYSMKKTQSSERSLDAQLWNAQKSHTLVVDWRWELGPTACNNRKLWGTNSNGICAVNLLRLEVTHRWGMRGQGPPSWLPAPNIKKAAGRQTLGSAPAKVTFGQQAAGRSAGILKKSDERNTLKLEY